MTQMALLFQLVLVFLLFTLNSKAEDIYTISVRDFRDHPLELLDRLRSINETADDSMTEELRQPIIDGYHPIEVRDQLYGSWSYFAQIRRDWRDTNVDVPTLWSCTGYPEGGMDNGCWKALNLDTYLKYYTKVQHGYNPAKFANSFLSLNTIPEDCSGIIYNSCGVPEIRGTPSVRYVARNIYGVNQYFNSWYRALSDASSEISDNIEKIVQLLDTPEEESIGLQDMTIALTALSAFTGPASALGGFLQGVDTITSSIKDFSETLHTALQADSSISETLYPTGGDASSQLFQIAELKDQVNTAVLAAKGNIQNTVEAVMKNSSLFLLFANQGKFSVEAPSLPPQTTYLWYIFNTFIISKALNGNNIYGVRAPNTDPVALGKNGTKLNYPLDDSKEYDVHNLSGPFWYNYKTQTAFGLDNFSDMDKDYSAVLRELIGKYTTGELLFQTAADCDALHNSDKPLNLTVDTNGPVACISHLKIVTWDMTCDDAPSTRKRTCEFVEPDVPRQHDFLNANKEVSSLWSYQTPETS